MRKSQKQENNFLKQFKAINHLKYQKSILAHEKTNHYCLQMSCKSKIYFFFPMSAQINLLKSNEYFENLNVVLRIPSWCTHHLSLFFTSPYFLSDKNFTNFTSFTWKLKDQIHIHYVYKEESPGMRKWNPWLLHWSPTSGCLPLFINVISTTKELWSSVPYWLSTLQQSPSPLLTTITKRKIHKQESFHKQELHILFFLVLPNISHCLHTPTHP